MTEALTALRFFLNCDVTGLRKEVSACRHDFKVKTLECIQQSKDSLWMSVLLIECLC